MDTPSLWQTWPKCGVAEASLVHGFSISQPKRWPKNRTCSSFPVACLTPARGDGRCTAAIESATPAPVLAAALFQRFSSRGEDYFADRIVSAMRYQFGGHLEREQFDGQLERQQLGGHHPERPSDE